MLLCQRNASHQPTSDAQEDIDWTSSARSYPGIEEAATFITTQQQFSIEHPINTHINPGNLQRKQRQVYDTIQTHFESHNPLPLHMIISGTAGTGKSYLINCLRILLDHHLRVAAPTSVAAFNVDGVTLHSLFGLLTKAEFKDLEGNRLNEMQQTLSNTRYLIIDEMSMVGRKIFGQLDKRLRQLFPHNAEHVFGGCSVIIFGDFGQLPPVMDLPLYTTISRSDLSEQGRCAYLHFNKVVVLDQVIRHAGQDPQQIQFWEILLRLRDGISTMDDWNYLMQRTPTEVQDLSLFANALHLYPTKEAVVEHNVAKLHDSNQPIATIKAVHTGPNACRASADEANGLEPVICLAKFARVMLISNLWVDAGLVNGAMGTIDEICYRTGGPPNLPLAVMVKFDHYSGPTFHGQGTVPIAPIRRTWFKSGCQCSRLQLPLRLAWAVTIHKLQGLTIDKLVVDIGKREFSPGLTFVACSRVRNIEDLLLSPPFPFQRLTSIGNSRQLRERLAEEQRLISMQESDQHN